MRAHPANKAAERIVEVLLDEVDPAQPELPLGDPEDALAADLARTAAKAARDNLIAHRGKPVTDFSIADHGVMSSDYFQGAGTAYTRWDAAYVGTGETAHEALSSAIDDAASDGWDTHVIKNEFPEVTEDTVERAVRNANPDAADEDGDVDTGDCYRYVVLYVEGEKE